MAYSFSTTFPLDFRVLTSEQQMRYKNELNKPYKPLIRLKRKALKMNALIIVDDIC